MTNTPRSSSNRTAGTCDAVVSRGQMVTGPVRLPIARASEFVEQFNRIYGKFGMNLIAIEARQNQITNSE